MSRTVWRLEEYHHPIQVSPSPHGHTYSHVHSRAGAHEFGHGQAHRLHHRIQCLPVRPRTTIPFVQLLGPLWLAMDHGIATGIQCTKAGKHSCSLALFKHSMQPIITSMNMTNVLVSESKLAYTSLSTSTPTCYIVIQIRSTRKGRLPTEQSGGPSPEAWAGAKWVCRGRSPLWSGSYTL